MAKKKLVRSANKVLAGVCGGIADYFDVDPTLIRVLYAVLSLFSAAFPGLLLYIILLLLIPEADRNDHYEDAQVVE
jgi:phage shock protein C